MQVTGEIIDILEPKSGVSTRGNWKSQEFVIETQDQYPKKICFNVFGEERIKQMNLERGVIVNVSFDINATEYNGKYYNNINAYSAIRV